VVFVVVSTYWLHG